MTALLRPGLPEGEPRWSGDPPFNFVGGHNDPASIPFGGFAEAAAVALARHGQALARYNLGGSPQGHLPLREFIAAALDRRAHMPTDPSEILVTSGSLQALDLVNAALLAPGDAVVVEEATYAGTLSRLAERDVEVHGVSLDGEGIRLDHLDELLGTLAARGRRPKFVYTIPTVQNPTGTVMGVERRRQLLEVARRHGVAIFEDDCYADLVFDGEPPAHHPLTGRHRRAGRVLRLVLQDAGTRPATGLHRGRLAPDGQAPGPQDRRRIGGAGADRRGGVRGCALRCTRLPAPPRH